MTFSYLNCKRFKLLLSFYILITIYIYILITTIGKLILKKSLIVCKKILSVVICFLNGSCEKTILSNLSKIFVCPYGINNLNLQIEKGSR